MTSNLFAGGLPYEITREELMELFSACGKVSDVKLIMDGFTGRSKGFGFVEMATEAEAQAAIAKLNGTTLGERTLFISEARPQENRPSRPGGSGGLPGKPGFVERRSGVKDRRRRQSVVAGNPRLGDKPRSDGVRREGFSGAKQGRNGPGSFGGMKKRRDKFGGGAEKRSDFGGKKKWGGKPSGNTDKRKDFGGKKKWGAPRSRPGRRDERRPS